MTWQDNIAADFGWIYDWQTLIGALCATGAAIVTVYAMHSQTRQARQINEGAMRRKSLAAQVRMPDALRGMSKFCGESASRILKKDRTLPDEPFRELEDLKTAIEFIDTGKAEQLFDLLSHYQVYTSRFPDYDDFVPEQAVYDSAKLNYYINRLFSYARNREDEMRDESERERLVYALETMVSLEDRLKNKDIFDGARKLIEANHPEYNV